MTGVFWLGLFTGLPSSSKRSFGDPADLIILKRFRNDRICLFDDISISWIPKPNGLRMTNWLDSRTSCENDGFSWHYDDKPVVLTNKPKYISPPPEDDGFWYYTYRQVVSSKTLHVTLTHQTYKCKRILKLLSKNKNLYKRLKAL